MTPTNYSSSLTGHFAQSLTCLLLPWGIRIHDAGKDGSSEEEGFASSKCSMDQMKTNHSKMQDQPQAGLTSDNQLGEFDCDRLPQLASPKS